MSIQYIICGNGAALQTAPTQAKRRVANEHRRSLDQP
jgi:hypothetical protein